MFYVYYSFRLLKTFLLGGVWPMSPLLPFVSCHPDSMFKMAGPLASATVLLACGLLLSWPSHLGRGGKGLLGSPWWLWGLVSISTLSSSAPGAKRCSGPDQDFAAQGALGRQWRERMLFVPFALGRQWRCLWNSGIPGIHLIVPC